VAEAGWQVGGVHTVVVRLRVRAHEAHGIDQRLFALGQPRNAVVRDARRRAELLRKDPRWRSHATISVLQARQAAYTQLRDEYRVGETATQDCPIHRIRLHRHLFSAWLMHITASPQSGGIPGLHEGTLATLLCRDPVLQESLVKLCAARRGRDKHPEGGRFASEGAAGRTAHEAKPTPTPPARNTQADVPGNAALSDPEDGPTAISTAIEYLHTFA